MPKLDRILQLQVRRDHLLAYLKDQLEQQNWHGVRDAAADLEIIDARIDEETVYFTPPAPAG